MNGKRTRPVFLRFLDLDGLRFEQRGFPIMNGKRLFAIFIGVVIVVSIANRIRKGQYRLAGFLLQRSANPGKFWAILVF